MLLERRAMLDKERFILAVKGRYGTMERYYKAVGLSRQRVWKILNEGARPETIERLLRPLCESERQKSRLRK